MNTPQKLQPGKKQGQFLGPIFTFNRLMTQKMPPTPLNPMNAKKKGDADMVDADPMATASDITIEDYTLRLDGICSQTFRDSKILVVGVGAGSYMVEKLARLCPSLLILVDPDIVEASNLARTSFSMDDIGYSKVESLANRIREINPFVEVKIYQSRIEDLAVDVL